MDLLIEGAIFALLAYLPLAFGGVMPSSEVVIIALTSLICGCFAYRCIAQTSARVVLSTAFLPLAALVAVVVLQLVPLPMALLELLSPNAAAAWIALGEARGEVPNSGTISLYPGGTRADLTLLLGAAVLIVVGSTIYHRKDAFRRLLAGIGLIGLAVAAVGLAQIVLEADKIYWYFDGPGGSPNSGPFASYSHYSEFINMAIGCALGYLLIRASQRALGHTITVPILIDPRGHGIKRLDKVLLAFVVIGAIAIVMSTSRNGLMSLVVGAGVAAALLHGFRKVDGIGWPMVIAAGFAVLGLLALGVDPVIRRFEDTFADADGSFAVRANLLRDTAAMIAAFPVFGAGLGSYWVTFPAYDSTARGGVAEHAENQYIESFAELGIVGGLLGVAVLGLIALAAWRRMRESKERSTLGLFGIAFAFGAFGFHSLTDFGLEIPAVGFLFACLLGATIAQSSTRTPDSAPASRPLGRFVLTGCSLAAAVGLLAGLPNALRATSAFEHGRSAEALRLEISRSADANTPELHADLARFSREAAEADPSNVEYRFWSAFSQWNKAVVDKHFALQTEDAEGNVIASPVTPDTAPELKEEARETIDALLASAEAGPTHGPIWSVAGQLRKIWLEETIEGSPVEHDPSGEWILRGRALAPHYPTTCLAAAFEYFRRGDESAALSELDRAIDVGASRRMVVDLLANDLNDPEMALPFVRGDLRLTDHLHRLIAESEEHAELAVKLEEEVYLLLVEAAESRGTRPADLHQLARIEVANERIDRAIELYQRMLGLEPYATRARFEYAQLLLNEGDRSGARRELRDILDYQPGFGGAQTLLDDLEGR